MISATVLSLHPLSNAGAAPSESLKWSHPPPLPDAEGFAGMFSGVSGHTLIAAGGANIVGDRWTDPLHKKWYDTVFVLDRPDGQWKVAGKLPRPSAYGVSITTPKGLVCIGGSDPTRSLADVFLLSLEGGQLRTTELPGLPVPAAYACGAVVGEILYVAGGIDSSDAPTALRRCWTLDLGTAHPAWQEIEPWPGPGRQKAVAGAMGDSFFLFGGAQIGRNPDGTNSTTLLKDAYSYTPGKGWRKRADLPFPAVAAPSPAVPRSGNELLLVGGDDGSHAGFQPPRDQPEFERRLQAYSVSEDRWTLAGTAPFSRVTAPAVPWNGGTVIPNGETRPRVRSPQVWQLQ